MTTVSTLRAHKRISAELKALSESELYDKASTKYRARFVEQFSNIGMDLTDADSDAVSIDQEKMVEVLKHLNTAKLKALDAIRPISNAPPTRKPTTDEEGLVHPAAVVFGLFLLLFLIGFVNGSLVCIGFLEKLLAP